MSTDRLGSNFRMTLAELSKRIDVLAAQQVQILEAQLRLQRVLEVLIDAISTAAAGQLTQVLRDHRGELNG